MTTQRKRRAASEPAGAKPVADHATADGFQNFTARLGIGAGSLQDDSGYGIGNPITRQPRQLEFMYRGSWIVGAAVDAVADDMIREGVDFGSTIAPDKIEKLRGCIDDIDLWGSIGDVERWARLYGGAIGVYLIDGQDPSTPLRPETVTQGAFKGILALSRWELMPTTNAVIGELGSHIGQPEFYQVGPQATAFQGKKVHHSRVIRREGIRLPYFQRLAEQGWGLSVVERMFDRLVAFDSATTGSAQLVYKAYLRTLKIKGLRDILAAGGAAEATLTKQVEGIRKFQSTEGLTLLDAEDDFDTHAYTFAGLDDLLLQFGQQLSGATGIPLVRLFGQSPAGLNSTGESDIRNYYDNIKALQKRNLRKPLTTTFDLLHRSVFGQKPDAGFNFEFNPLWQLTEEQRANIAKTITETVVGASSEGLISKPAAMRELRQSSDITGVFTNISDGDIEEAENEPPAPEEDASGPEVGGFPSFGPAQDRVAGMGLHGLSIVIETPKGAIRRGGEGLQAWQVVMPEHYGYIDGTWSAEGEHEAMDCFVGPDASSTKAWIIDQVEPNTGGFDEHKVMLGFGSEADAVSCYLHAYHDGRAMDRIAGVTEMDIDALKDWLASGALDRPASGYRA